MVKAEEIPTYAGAPSHRRRKIAIAAILLIVAIGGSVFIALPSPRLAPETEKVSVATAEQAPMTSATHFALIQGLVPSPETAGVIYVATFTGLVIGMNSSDREYEFFYVNPERLDLTGLIIHPEEPEVFYSFGHPSLAEETGIRRSEDRGQTWELVTSRPDPHEWVISLDKPEVMYAVDFPSLVLVKSEDGGLGWKVLQSPSRVYSIGINPQNVKVVFIGTDSGLYVSKDGGSTWEVASDECNFFSCST
ncbi:MAG: WD40/YVTN/BNR-like repeat-containing protein [Candidatus Bathyarchaeia archaeon]